MRVVDADLERLARDLAEALPGRVEQDRPLADLTTYRIGGPAAVLARAGSTRELDAVAAVVAACRPPVLVLGRGSNLLVADRGFPGLVLVLDGDFEQIDVRDDAVRAGGAVLLPVLARRAAAAGRTGLEFYVGIPGSVGGAVRMNAGGHGRETRDVLRSAWVVDLLGGGGEEARTPVDLALGYRSSALGDAEVVARVELAVTADRPEDCEARLAEIVRWRREHQPGGSNAGSVFRNPPGDSAGRLVDACGLKGLRHGGARVSEKHANFFLAEPGTTAEDVRRLVLDVRRRVAAATGVVLVPELRMVGFESPPTEGAAP